MKYIVRFSDGMTVIELDRTPMIGQTIDVGRGAVARVDAIVDDGAGRLIEATRLFGVGEQKPL